MEKNNNKPVRIMIVDDDPNQIDILEALLRQMRYEVNSAFTGKEGVELSLNWRPDVVLMDLYLPDINGIQVAEEMRNNKKLRSVPIIMMSADFKEETVINALANGIDEFVSKPIRIAELTLRIGTILELKRKEQLLNKMNIQLNKEKGILAKYFSYDFVEKVLNENISPNLGGTNIKASILFFDLRNSTQIAEKMQPEQFSVFLSEILKNSMDIVFDHGGSVNKLLGDGMLATFGCPNPGDNDTLNCCRCALDIRKYIENFNQKDNHFTLKDPIKAGIGISTGEIFAGNIGSARRMEYTVLGDSVNVASRLENLTKRLKVGTVDILIDGETKKNINSQFKTRMVKGAKIRGKEQAVDIYYLDQITH